MEREKEMQRKRRGGRKAGRVSRGERGGGGRMRKTGKGSGEKERRLELLWTRRRFGAEL